MKWAFPRRFREALTAAIIIIGSVLSGHAQPAILEEPQSQTVPKRALVTLSVVADGTGPLRYHWMKNGRRIAGRRPTLRFLANQYRAGTYAVSVKDATGQEVVSDPAIVQVKTPPVILVQPKDCVVVEHGTAVFQCVLNGSGPYTSIAWWNDNELEGPHQIPDTIGLQVHGPRLEIPNSLNVNYYNGIYWLAVTNEAGGTISRKARLTVVPAQ